jgi:hypothetical protein
MNRRDDLDGISARWRETLKWIIKRVVLYKDGLDSFGSGHGKIPRYCECGNGSPYSIKGRELQQFNDYLSTDPEVPVSIPGATGFSEK